jgi:Ser/Thr protein kinase RdoA (MazF antagonist)
MALSSTMSVPSFDQAAAVVLRNYPGLRDYRLVSLGKRGGFSGARLWRIETTAAAFCLRAWPTDGPTRARLQQIHDWMVSAVHAGLNFVPRLLAGDTGKTSIDHAGRLWELSDWLPGKADFHDRPTPARIAAAFTALACLHRVWAVLRSEAGPCPAVLRRLERYRDWSVLVRSGWQPEFGCVNDGPTRPWAERAWTLLRDRMPSIPETLAPFERQAVRLQPCLCDIWHDHVLFEGDRVTGLIDYGGAKTDHVAVDLARLLGSLAGDDVSLRAAALQAYARLCPPSHHEEALVRALDETGTLLGAANWLMWLYNEGRQFDDRQEVARRLAALVQRIEKCNV